MKKSFIYSLIQPTIFRRTYDEYVDDDDEDNGPKRIRVPRILFKPRRSEMKQLKLNFPQSRINRENASETYVQVRDYILEFM